ncbi:MAG: hypothetical protein JSW11_00975 [Candidatus Heimdallarchaeota archaeon]|nr:MAG: hypothetical protein JSW11_00975 [Candidatus Heimdallarchaeota archaeon]
MKIKLTKNWRRPHGSMRMEAACHNLRLLCCFEWPDGKHNIKYFGVVHLYDYSGSIIYSLRGKYKDRESRAIKDAEKLAVELLLNLKESINILIKSSILC